MQTVTLEQLKELNFKEYAQFTIKEASINLSYEGQECIEFGHVYLWLAKKDQAFNVIYVGKAGKTMKNRCRQHLGGFRGSERGLSHAQNLKEGHKNGFSFHIFSRKSDTMTVFGEKISLHSAEEEALIKKFSPPWNKL